MDRALLRFWRWATDEANVRYVRLVFEVHALAPHHPRLYGEYVREALRSWRLLVVERLSKRNTTARQREELATLIIAVVDGLLLDYLATGDLDRTTRTLLRFIKRLKANGGTP